MNTVISASAGSGKTFRLTLRYIKLLNLGVNPERIIALTFTKKAAGEIFNKIIERLLVWYERGDLLEKECKIDNIQGMTKNRVFELLKKIINVQYAVIISTLDSFFFKILQAFSYEYNIDSNLEVVDEENGYVILENTLKELLFKNLSEGLKNNLFEAFKQATFGKEEVSIYKTIEDFIRSHYAIFKKYPESNIWGNTGILPDSFKRSYNIDMQSVNKMFEGTYVTSKVFNRFKESIFDANNFTEESVLDDKISELFKRIGSLDGGLSTVLKASTDNKSISLRFGNKMIEFNATIIFQAAMKYLSSIFRAKLYETQGIYKALSLYNAKYLNSVRCNGLIAFDDIVLFLRRNPLTVNPPHEPNHLYIDYRLDTRYDHWLIDEFQDTNRMQWEVIANLIDEIMNDTTGERSFFYVGDVKQAIFSWRGGDLYLFNYVKNKYDERLVAEELFKSYRSSKAIIDTVNLVFSNIHKIKELDVEVLRLWRENWTSHQTVKLEQGYSVVYKFDPSKTPEHEGPELPLSQIVDILHYVKPLRNGLSVGILVLRNTDADRIEEYLTSKGIPCAKEGSFQLTNSPAVKLLLSLFKIIHHPGDTIALGTIELSALLYCLPNEGGKLKLKDTIKMLVEELGMLGFSDFTIKWANIIKGKVLQYNSTIDELRLDQMAYAAALYRDDNSDTIAFIKYISNYKIPVKTDEKCVQIITVYKAKGLEYDMVILPKLSIGRGILNAEIHRGVHVLDNMQSPREIALLLPPRDIAIASDNMKEKIRKLDVGYSYEQLSVLYVALTRARKAMYVFSEPDSERETTIHLNTIVNRLLVGPSNISSKTGINLPPIYEHGNPEWFVSKL